MTTLITKLQTLLTGDYVGSDSLGNKYYQSRRMNAVTGKKRRWVVYNGTDDASCVAPSWHGWLHYTLENPPDDGEESRYNWQREPSPNKTGSHQAYMPSGHILKEGTPAKDYQAWDPSEE